jgi:uncharacterized protein (TIGR03000 family)
LGGYRGFSRGGFPGGRYGNYHPYHGYRRHLYGYYPYSSYYPYSGYYPNYDSYPYEYDYPYDDSYPSYTSPPVYGSDVGTQPDQIAHVTVTLPAKARLWFDKRKVKETGHVRRFKSPPLKAGRKYTYTLRARWKKNGHTVTQTRTVAVSPGAHVRVHFPVPRKTTVHAKASTQG